MQVRESDIQEIADALSARLKAECIKEIAMLQAELKREKALRAGAERVVADVTRFEMLRNAGFTDIWASDRFTAEVRKAWRMYDAACAIVAVGTIDDAIACGYNHNTTMGWQAWICVQALLGTLHMPADMHSRITELRHQIYTRFDTDEESGV